MQGPIRTHPETATPRLTPLAAASSKISRHCPAPPPFAAAAIRMPYVTWLGSAPATHIRSNTPWASPRRPSLARPCARAETPLARGSPASLQPRGARCHPHLHQSVPAPDPHARPRSLRHPQHLLRRPGAAPVHRRVDQRVPRRIVRLHPAPPHPRQRAPRPRPSAAPRQRLRHWVERPRRLPLGSLSAPPLRQA